MHKLNFLILTEQDSLDKTAIQIYENLYLLRFYFIKIKNNIPKKDIHEAFFLQKKNLKVFLVINIIIWL